jgi:hypothetical protein
MIEVYHDLPQAEESSIQHALKTSAVWPFNTLLVEEVGGRGKGGGGAGVHLLILIVA